jgi:hypothetical protein
VHPILVLGPQRHRPTVAPAMEAAGLPEGPLAVVTGGWEEREAEVQELADHLERPVRNLELWRRANALVDAHPDLLEAWRHRRLRLREQAELYRIRLERLVRTLRRLERHAGSPDLVRQACDECVTTIQELDASQVRTVEVLRQEFEAVWGPSRFEPLGREVEDLEGILADCPTVAIAGGNVAVLLNTLHFFALERPLARRALVAWSSGAMTLADRIVLFHDSPPQGPGLAEVLGAGLGLCPGVVFLPHARRRLRLEDPARVAALARRFAPALCVPLDDGEGALWTEGRWTLAVGGAWRLTPEGTVEELTA